MAGESNENILPERIIKRMFDLAIPAISANLTILDDILSNLENSDEQEKARAFWASDPPAVYLSYPRRGSSRFPCYAITLAGDVPNQDFLGLGEQAWVQDDVTTGKEFNVRFQTTFSIYVYSQHVDVCAWWYRVAKRILNVGRTYMINAGLNDPKIDGVELMPDPQYNPENLFVRRLNLTVEYNETWTDQDPLWEALNGTPEAFATSVRVYHEDQIGLDGGVSPYAEED